MRRITLLFILVPFGWTTLAVRSEVQPDKLPNMPPHLTVTLVGQPELVFNWKKDRCETIDIPDAPARAFKDAFGETHLVASHYVTREMIGPTLDQLRHDCTIAFTSNLNDQFDLFEDREWLTSFYTLDGKTIYSLAHNEFHGNTRPTICPSRNYFRCWSNQITMVTSTDGGYTFRRPQQHLVAMPPYRYEAEHGSPVGYFNPTNILEFDRYYYTLFRATQYREQLNGVCIMRTNNLADPAAWRAWDGSGFNIAFANPYVQKIDSPVDHICAPLKSGRLVDVGGLAREKTSGAFILTMKGAIQIDNAGHTASGIWITGSFDLTNWSTPVLAWADPSGSTTWENTVDAFPSIIDPASDSRNFETTNKDPYIYFVRFDPANRPYARQLLRQRIEVEIRR